MSISYHDKDNPLERTHADLERLRGLGFMCTADFIVQSTRANTSMDRADIAFPAAGPIGFGRFIAGGGALLGADTRAGLIEQLREQLARHQKNRAGKLDELMELWTLAEAMMPPQEAEELRPLLDRHLSGDASGKPVLSRGAGRQGGGL